MNDENAIQELHDTSDWMQERDAVLDKLKDDVNAFLWTRLNPSMTMGAAESIAAEIHELIAAAWRR